MSQSSVAALSAFRLPSNWLNAARTCVYSIGKSRRKRRRGPRRRPAAEARIHHRHRAKRRHNRSRRHRHNCRRRHRRHRRGRLPRRRPHPRQVGPLRCQSIGPAAPEHWPGRPRRTASQHQGANLKPRFQPPRMAAAAPLQNWLARQRAAAHHESEQPCRQPPRLRLGLPNIFMIVPR